MAQPTVAAGFPKAFLDFAASRGADRLTLIELSQISSDDLIDPNNRVPLANYVELLQAGVELCDEPAIALHFGEAVKMQDISIVCLIGETVESWESGRQQTNRYACLMLDDDRGNPSHRIEVVREDVEGLLTPILHAGEANIESVAGKLGLSRQTLFSQAESGGRNVREGSG